MDGLDFSTLRPVGSEQPDVAAPAPEAAAPLDLSSLRPASAGVHPQAAPEKGDDLLGQFGAGLATGIPNALVGTIEAQERGRKIGLPPGADVIGGFLQPAIAPLLDKISGRQSAPVETPMSQSLREGLKKTGFDVNDYFEEPKSAGERIARMGGEGAITSIMPGGQAKGWERLIQIAKELGIGAAAGAGSQVGIEAAPDEWKGAAALVGGLTGGIGGALVTEAPQAAARLAGKGVDYLKPIVARDATDMAPEVAADTTTGKLAAQKLGNIATDPVAAAEALRTVPEYVPGSKPSAFQASGDIGLGSFEKALARNDDKFKAALLDRVDEQNAARVAALTDIESTGDIGAAVQFFRDRMRTLEEHADTLYDRADKAAKGQYDALGDRAAADIGEQARTAISSKFKGMNGEASALWNSIDPEHNMHVATQPLVTATARIYGAMSPEEKINLAPYEKNIAGIIGEYGDTLPFDRFKDLRSAITTGMRDAKSFASPNLNAYRRLSMLREAVENAVEESVSQKFEADPGLAEQFVKQARDWYENRSAETGAIAATGTEGGAGAGAPAAAGASGENGAPSRGPAGPARDQGLPQDVARAVPEAPPPAPVVEAPALAPRPAGEPLPPGGAIEQLDPRDIGVDARRFQFKEGGDERGVTERLQGVEKWDPRLAGTALVYRDAGGRNWVADGHQRMGLARRLIENGHPPFKVNAFILDAADGITDADARAIAAVKNIAEGTGTPIDAAKVLRAAKETGVDLPPLPPRSALVRDGEALANLSPEALGMVINEVIPAAQGAIVGRMVKDHAAQEEALRVLAKLKPDNARQAEMVVRDLLNSGVEQMTRQGGLFGEEAFASSVVLERAKIADQALKLLKQDKKLFGTLVEEAERIEGAGNALNRDANATRLSTDEKAADLLTQLAFRAGPVSTELTRLARALKAGDQTAHAAARDFLGAIRREVESGVDAGDIAGGAGTRAAGEEAPPLERDPDTVEMFQSAPPVESPAFKRWFGDSKVVDADGRPMVVYHGTNQPIEQFNPKRGGSATGENAGATKAIFFTSDKVEADQYARHAGRRIPANIEAVERERTQLKRDVARFEKARNWDAYETAMAKWEELEGRIAREDDTVGRNIVETYLSIKNPMEVDFEGGRISGDKDLDLLIDKAKAAGHDGLILKNIEDSPEMGIVSTQYAVFDPTQAKSVNNRGTFDPKDPRLLYQGKPKPWQPGDMLGEFNTERGLEGLPQAVIPGAEVTDANRMQSQASKPLKGGNAPPPRGGLFDEAGREDAASQMSLFQSGAGAPIRDTMADRFAAAGRPPEEAVAAGELVNAFYTTMAERLGKPVDEIVAQHPLPQVRKGPDPEATLFQPAYHGTPHIFDKFDSSKIGTGEGAQAFGHGLYFAGKKGVAEYYRDKLSAKPIDEVDHVITFVVRHPAPADAPAGYLAERIENQLSSNGISLSPEEMKLAVRAARGGNAKYDGTIDYSADAVKALSELDTLMAKRHKGRLLTVDLPEDHELLAWDRPLSEQPKAIQEKLATLGIAPRAKSEWKPYPSETEKPIIIDQHGSEIANHGDYFSVFGKNWDNRTIHLGDPKTLAKAKKLVEDQYAYDRAFTGEQLYKQLSARERGDAKASTMLREAGIPGHRFLDQQSRVTNPRVKAMIAEYGSRQKALEQARRRQSEVANGTAQDRKMWADTVSELSRDESHNYVIYDDSRVNVTNYEQGARGSIQFGDDGAVISMFKGADASTALHESGHHFLEMFKSMATGPDAPAAIANDWRAAKAWWDKNAADVAKDGGEGITPADVRTVLRDGTTGDRMKDLAVDRGLHEQWARGLETYLRDGKAPNSALRAIFEQFKTWLSSVYSHADQLGVKMSPEIRRVFDNMLAPESSRGPKMLDAAAAQRFSKATAATRLMKQRFTDKTASPVPEMLRGKNILRDPEDIVEGDVPDYSYEYDMPDERIPEKVWQPGAKGPPAIRSLRRGGIEPDAIDAAAILSLKRAATKDGMIEPKAFAAWRQKYADNLREMPELDRRLRTASQASETVTDIAGRRKEALDLVERSAVGKLLKVQDDADVSAVVGRMLGKDTAVRDMRSLAAEARRDPDALAGLRRALVEHMVGKMKTPKDALRADTFQKFLGKNTPALQQVLTPEQMNSLRAIASDMKRASKEVRAPGGGSDTAENLAARGNYALEHPSIIGQIFRNVLTSGALGVVAHLAQGPVMGAISAVGSFLGGSVVQAFRQAGIRKVDDLIREAVLDPELMRALLLKAPKRGNTGSAITMRERLGRIAANNLAISAARDGKPETAGD